MVVPRLQSVAPAEPRHRGSDKRGRLVPRVDPQGAETAPQ